MVLLRGDKAVPDLMLGVQEQLEDFLFEGTSEFVQELFDAIASKAYQGQGMVLCVQRRDIVLYDVILNAVNAY